MALQTNGLFWAGTAMNVVLISAILSTMLAAMFALGRMIRSLADEHMAPNWLRDKGDVPYRGILCSGAAMLLALRFGLFFPRVYLFLISSGGFALLFSYAVIMATHIRFRKKFGCPPDGDCQMRGFPYTSVFVLVSLIAAIASMPFVKDQLSGLIAGVCLVAFYIVCYGIARYIKVRKRLHDYGPSRLANAEFSKELNDFDHDED
jgi:L-asparagine transporter-like permease